MSNQVVAEHMRSGTQAIERAVEVLRYIAANDVSGARLVDITRDLQLHRSTAHRILSCLLNERLVSIKQPDHRYILGSLTYELGLRAARREGFNTLCRPSLERIAKTTGDVVFLSVRSGLETVCIDRAEGDYPIRAYTRQIGDRRPIGFGAVGIAMLALLPDEIVEETIKQAAQALRIFNGETPQQSWARVLRARTYGFALNVREKLGLRAIALPIRDATNEPIAAISVCAIASRLGMERAKELAPLIADEVRLIEEQLKAENHLK
jgi:DNA-binding IclR family transcriptional regulator